MQSSLCFFVKAPTTVSSSDFQSHSLTSSSLGRTRIDLINFCHRWAPQTCCGVCRHFAHCFILWLSLFHSVAEPVSFCG